MENIKDKKVLISGASIAGLSTAYWMNKLGYEVTVVEIANKFRTAGGAINIEGPASEAIKRIGILENVKSNRLNVELIEFKDRNGKTVSSMALKKDEQDLTDDDIEIERDKILYALFDNIKDDVKIIFENRITALQEINDSILVTFKTGAQQTYDLLIGCDGTHSGVRKLWFGEEKQFSNFLGGYFSIVIVDKLLIKQKTVQMYNVPDKGIMLNAYNNKTDVIFCFNTDKEIPYDYRNMEEQRQIILDQFEGLGWRTSELLDEIRNSETIYFDKFCQIKMPIWTKGRVALVGDAAYSPSPAAGKGGSMAIVGATALADALEKHNGDHESAFREYNESLRTFMDDIQAAAESNVRELVPRTEEDIRNRKHRRIFKYLERYKVEQKLSFTSNQIIIIAILALLQFTIILDFLVIAPLSDVFIKTMGMTTSDFGKVVSAYAFSAGISGLLAAGFADRFDRKKLLIFFYVGFIVGTLFCALSNSYYTLLFSRIVTGLFGGVIGSILLAIMTDLFEVNQRGRVLGYIQMAFAASQILGIPLGLYLSNLWGWHSVFLMIECLSLPVLLAVFVKLPKVTQHLKHKSEKNPFIHVWNTLRNKSYQTGLIAVSVLGIVGFMLQPFNSSYLVNNIHMTQKQLPVIFFSIGIAVLIIMPVIGKLSDKVNKFRLFTVGCIASIIMVLIYTNLPPLPMWEVIIVSILLFMVIMGRVVPATTLNTGIPETYDRGAYMSITASIQQMSGGIASVFVGYVIHQQTPTSPLSNYNILGYIITILTIISIFLIYRVNETSQNKVQS